MAKRYTDTKKWHDQWFRELPCKIKMLWIYLLDNCDHAGIWKIDLPLASFCIGENISKDDFEVLRDRLIDIKPGVIMIKKFIAYQYGKKLNESNKVHQSVIKILEDNSIEIDNIDKIDLCQGSKDKDKDKEKDKDKDIVLRQEVEKEFRNQEEFTDFVKQRTCIKSFLNKCKLKKVDPFSFMRQFLELRKHDKKFDLPFSPSILSSWFDTIYHKIKQEESFVCNVCGASKIKEHGKFKCLTCNTS